MRNMGTAGNPWGYSQEERHHWAEGLDVPRIGDGEHYEVLYWVGCSAAYDKRNQKIARSVVRLLQAAGVRFAVLEQERCTAESARRLGEEYLYQTATEENVGNLNGASFDRVVTHCPHCFNTIKNEYPQFGGNYNVIHHSQLIQELVAAGRLTGLDKLDQRVAFHDSCYLGRYNGEFEAPRDTLRAAGVDVVELPRNRDKGLCCGGGGGQMWFEHKATKDVNVIRLEEALSVQPDVIGVACPFCLTMLDSAAKSAGATDVEVLDVAEVLVRALDGAGPAK
jgi:Fe-S oxidoreductase